MQGRVRLVGQLFDLSGNPLGTQSVDDASGVPIYLLDQAGARIDSTNAEGGEYRFEDVPAGTYRVASRVLPSLLIEGGLFSLDRAGTADADTLTLAFQGEMRTSPNPPEEIGFGYEFDAQSAGRYEIQMLSLSLEPIWAVSDSTVGGFNHIHWSGRDDHGQPITAGPYWAVLHVDGRDAFNLVFWEHGTHPIEHGDCGHLNAAGFVLDRADSTLAYSWQGAVHGALELAISEELRGIRLTFLSPDSTRFALADTCSVNHMTWTIESPAIAEVTADPGSKWRFDVRGLSTGSTTLFLKVWHETHVHYMAPGVPIVVTP